MTCCTSRQAGLSLLEVMVAFVILAFSLGVLYRADAGNLRAVGEAGQQERAVALAQSLLDLRDAVPAAGWNESGESAGYQWVVRSAPYASAASSTAAVPLQEVEISVRWAAAGADKEFSVATLRPQARPVTAP